MAVGCGCLAALCFALLLVFCEADEATQVNRDTRQTDNRIESGNGIVGIESIAGITSRNGRVSSLGGIRLIPASRDGRNYFYPLINPNIFYEGQNIGRSTYYPAATNFFPSPENFPAISDYRTQAANNYEASAYSGVRPNFLDVPQNPWFQKNLFDNIAQSNVRVNEALKNNWFYPQVSPFNNMYFW